MGICFATISVRPGYVTNFFLKSCTPAMLFFLNSVRTIRTGCLFHKAKIILKVYYRKSRT